MDTDELAGPVDLSAEAVLELEELRQGARADAPALNKLFHFISTPPPSAFEGQGSVSMLDDVRAYALFRESLGTKNSQAKDWTDFKKVVHAYLNDLQKGVEAHNHEKIKEARRFCLSLSGNLLAKQMAEVYQRRESSDARYVSHESFSQLQTKA